MALGAHGLPRPAMTGEAGRVVMLPSRGVDLKNVCRFPCWAGDEAVATVAGSSLRMGTVFEVIETRGRSKPGAVLQRHRAIGVTDRALAEFLAGLMRVAAIALGMLREASLRASVQPVAAIAFQLLASSRPLSGVGVHMLAVRETFQSKLLQSSRKAYQLSLCVDRRLMAARA